MRIICAWIVYVLAVRISNETAACHQSALIFVDQVPGDSASGKHNDEAQGFLGLLDAISAGSCPGISVAMHSMIENDLAIQHLLEDSGGPEPLVKMLASTSLPMPVRRSAAAGIFGKDLQSTSMQEVDELDMCI